MAVVATPPQGPVRLPRTLSDTNAPHQPLLLSMEEQSAGDEVPAESALSLASVCASYAFAPAPGDLISPADWLGSPHLLAAASYPGALRVAGGGRGLSSAFTRLSCEQQLGVFAASLDKNGEVSESALACCAQPPSDVMVCVCFLFPFLPVALQGNQFGQGKHRTKSSREYARVLRQV